LKELINWYVKEKFHLYIASVDAETAYDSLWNLLKLKDSIDKQFWLKVIKADGVFKINNNIIKIAREVKIRNEK
jgi:hypothetical protein